MELLFNFSSLAKNSYGFSDILKNGPELANSSLTGHYLFFIIAIIVLAFVLGIIFLVRMAKHFPEEKKILQQKIRLLEEDGKNLKAEQGQIQHFKNTCDELQHRLAGLAGQIERSKKEKKQFLGEKGELIVTLKRNEERVQELQHKKNELEAAKRRLEMILKERETQDQEAKKMKESDLGKNNEDLSKDIERYKDVLRHVSSLQERLAGPEEEVVVQEKSDLDSKDSQETSSLSDGEAKRIIDSSAALGKYLP